MTNEQKHKLKKILFGLSSEEEKKELNALEASALNLKLEKIAEGISKNSLDKLLPALLNAMDMVKKSSARSQELMAEKMEVLFGALSKAFVDKIEELKKVNPYEEYSRQSIPLYKDIISGLTGVNKSIQDKPVASWRWPQYASISVRDKNFANINPATEDTLQLILAAVGGSATLFTDGEVSVSVTNTPIAIGSADCKTIFINAKVGNSDIVVVGGPTVVYSPAASRTGKILYPGDTITITLPNLNLVYVNGAAGDGLSYSYTS